MQRLRSCLAITILLAACTDDDRQTSDEHVWKEQTETIEKTEEVDQMIQDAADRQHRAIEDQSR